MCGSLPSCRDVPGTREMRELSLALRTPRGLILITGCSHPGIEKILAASRTIEGRVYSIFGGLHLVLTRESRKFAVSPRPCTMNRVEL
jgi:7,8-dihydropterin-6-yl-methyl-4-(beta-D-ribofuranosyl)aminobenzene 5'-phosphate synthase